MLNIVIHLAPNSNMVNYERLYVATMGTLELCYIRAKSAKHAEAKLQFCFKRELPGKTLDFNLEQFTGEIADAPDTDEPAEKKCEKVQEEFLL